PLPTILSLFPYTTLFRSAPLEEMIRSSPNPLARMHALWTLAGMQKLDAATMRMMLADREPKNRAMAIRASETLQAPKRAEILPRSEEHTSELQSPDHLVC